MTLSLTEGIPCCLPASVHQDFVFPGAVVVDQAVPHSHSHTLNLPLGLCGNLFWSFRPEVLPFLKPALWEWHEYSLRALSLSLYIPQCVGG